MSDCARCKSRDAAPKHLYCALCIKAVKHMTGAWIVPQTEYFGVDRSVTVTAVEDDDPEEGWIDVSDLEPACIKTLQNLANRMRRGRRQYGDLNLSAKNWGREALEEILDMTNYLTFELVRMLDEAGK